MTSGADFTLTAKRESSEKMIAGGTFAYISTLAAAKLNLKPWPRSDC
jgi:hypothetical protein